jgi:hypothetical protein
MDRQAAAVSWFLGQGVVVYDPAGGDARRSLSTEEVNTMLKENGFEKVEDLQFLEPHVAERLGVTQACDLGALRHLQLSLEDSPDSTSSSAPAQPFVLPLGTSLPETGAQVVTGLGWHCVRADNLAAASGQFDKLNLIQWPSEGKLCRDSLTSTEDIDGVKTSCQIGNSDVDDNAAGEKRPRQASGTSLPSQAWTLEEGKKRMDLPEMTLFLEYLSTTFFDLKKQNGYEHATERAFD